MATSYDANVACSQIHEFVQASGLHFVIKQTPWSSYITLRKKFVNSDNFLNGANTHAMSPDLATLDEKNKQLENKVAKLELELVEAEEEYNKEKQKSMEKEQPWDQTWCTW